MSTEHWQLTPTMLHARGGRSMQSMRDWLWEQWPRTPNHQLRSGTEHPSTQSRSTCARRTGEGLASTELFDRGVLTDLLARSVLPNVPIWQACKVVRLHALQLERIECVIISEISSFRPPHYRMRLKISCAYATCWSSGIVEYATLRGHVLCLA